MICWEHYYPGPMLQKLTPPTISFEGCLSCWLTDPDFRESFSLVGGERLSCSQWRGKMKDQGWRHSHHPSLFNVFFSAIKMTKNGTNKLASLEVD